jgi:hypothetical protein
MKGHEASPESSERGALSKRGSKACAANLGEMDGIRETDCRINDQFDYILCKYTLPSRFQAWQG